MDNDGVSPIISMILIISIMLLVTGALLAWGVPTIQRMEADAQYRNARNNMEVIDVTIEDLLQEGEGATRTERVVFSGGQVLIKSSSERWILSYSLTDVDVVYSGLDDGDSLFAINSSVPLVNVSVYWPQGDDFSRYVPYFNISGTTVIDAFEDLVGLVLIEVRDASDNVPISRLWLFDIGCIIYKMASPIGEFTIKEVNGALLTDTPGGESILSESSGTIERVGESLLLTMIPLSPSGATSGGAGSYSLSFKSVYVGIRESSDVYFLRVQIYDLNNERWNETWYDHFIQDWNYASSHRLTQGFEGFVPDDEGVIYQADEAIELKLVESVIDVDMERR